MFMLTPAITTPKTKLLDVEGAAEHLTVCVSTMNGWRHRGGGPPYIRLSRNKVAYRVEDLDAWIASRVCTSTADESASRPGRGS